MVISLTNEQLLVTNRIFAFGVNDGVIINLTFCVNTVNLTRRSIFGGILQ